MAYTKDAAALNELRRKTGPWQDDDKGTDPKGRGRGPKAESPA